MQNKRREQELAALLGALGETPAHESWLPALTGWPEPLIRTLLKTLAGKGHLHLEKGWIHLTTGSEEHAAAMRALLGRMNTAEAGTGLFAFFRLQALAQPLDALESLVLLARELVKKGKRLELRLIYRIFMKNTATLRLRGFSKAEAGRYIGLCHDAFQMSLCISLPCTFLPAVLLRGRALAKRHGEHIQMRLLELLIGATNCLAHPGHNAAHFHLMMEQALTALQGEEYLLQSYPLPVGIYFFMQGKFRRAMDTLLPEPVNSSGWPEIHSRTQRSILASLAAFFLGESDEALDILRRALSILPGPAYPGLARILRATLALIHLGRNEDDRALELLDVGISGTYGQWDMLGWQHLMFALALYHAARGHIRAAAVVLNKGTEAALKEGYSRPTYLFPDMLELLESVHDAGFEVPGYNPDAELEICLNGSNQILRGVALRIRGNRFMKAGNRDEALSCYEQSLALLRSMHAYDEAAKTRIALASCHLARNERKLATACAIVASLRSNVTGFPPEIAELLPPRPLPDMKREPHASTDMEMIDLYLDSLREKTWSSPKIFIRYLVALSCRVLGMSSGYLFARGETPNGPVIIAQHGTEQESPDQAVVRSMRTALVEFALNGTPVLIAVPSEPGLDYVRSVICIPLPCGEHTCVLYHDGILPAWAEALLDEALLRRIGQVLGREMLLAGYAPSREKVPPRTSVSAETGENDELIFHCGVMKEFIRRADLAAISDASVLLVGESGVGKELVARRIHERSGRRGEFVAVNLAGIPDELFENEFLGHERGAFTGAWHQKKGLLELADNGTLFLDELAETSPRVQVKLLRLLQERSFFRLGGTRPIRSNFRLVAATNSDLDLAVRRGMFREDLYYRIRVIALHIPPLRERREDIPFLVRHYLHRFMHLYGHKNLALPQNELDKLVNHDWPGNIRELRNRMEQFVVLQGLDSILPPAPPPLPGSPPESGTLLSGELRWDQLLEHMGALPEPPTLVQVQEAYIAAVLKRCRGKIDGPTGAAQLLDTGRSSLYARKRELDRKKLQPAAPLPSDGPGMESETLYARSESSDIPQYEHDPKKHGMRCRSAEA